MRSLLVDKYIAIDCTKSRNNTIKINEDLKKNPERPFIILENFIFDILGNIFYFSGAYVCLGCNVAKCQSLIKLMFNICK